ncbi:MAG: tetratricopeptide repeat protein [Kiritimatiellae bacterium]|nr:tetratricopeptide repeat protein [Kiritimatiellia bacterium]
MDHHKDYFKRLPEQKRKFDLLVMVGICGLAAVVYLCTLSGGLFPGESASLVSLLTGIETRALPHHPLFTSIIGTLSHIPIFPLPLRLNLFSMICTIVSAGLLYRLVNQLVYDLIEEEHAVQYAEQASTWAAGVSAAAYLFSAPVWQAATRLQYQSFDLLFAVAVASVLMAYIHRRQNWLLALFAVLWGLFTVETAVAIPLAPVYLGFLIYILFKCRRLTWHRVAWILVLAIGFALAVFWLNASHFYATLEKDLIPFKSTGEVVQAIVKANVATVKGFLPSDGWLVVLLLAPVPWLASVIVSFKTLNNERLLSHYALHIVLFLIIVFDLLNLSFTPFGACEQTGQLPNFLATMVALTAGYLAAYLFLMHKVHHARRTSNTSRFVRKTGEWLGLTLFYPCLIVVALGAALNWSSCSGRRGAYADRCAKEILDRMGSRTWFISDGALDPHLKVMAQMRKMELNLISLNRDTDPIYLKQLTKLVEEKQLLPESSMRRMRHTLELGVLPFIQDWFASDKELEKKVAVLGVPDFWYSAGLTPVPEYLFFGGSRDIKKDFADKNPFESHLSFWQEMDKVLAPNAKHLDDPVIALRAGLRRHMGFVANNLGVMLEDLDRPDDAFKTYSYVHTTIDPTNISSLFNRYMMARNGVKAAVLQKDAIERELKEFMANLKGNKYPLWSLSRFYGYIRSPELFAKLGWGWALSGQTGAALAGIDQAIKLVPESERDLARKQATAAVYSLFDEKQKSKMAYEDILKTDPNNQAALLALAKMAIAEGATEVAKDYLSRAAKTDLPAGALGVEWATIHLMNDDLAHARLTLQETTDLQPKNLQAWSMLAMIQLTQNELEDLEKVTLPKMVSIAGSDNDYYVQVIRAQIATKRIEEIRKKAIADKTPVTPESPTGKKITALQHAAREGYIQASILRQDVVAVKDKILQLDIEMNDAANAELHARQVLRVNRKHYLANYVLGSLRLQQNEYEGAEDFLRASVADKPTPAALNDLAEVLRRLKKYEAAEQYAREAIKANETLYTAWETLACILLESGGDLNEAEAAVNHSLQLFDKDLRIKITLARILLKKGDFERARSLIGQIKSRQSELGPFDLEALNKLSEQTMKGRK